MKLITGFVLNKTFITQYFAALLAALTGVIVGPLPSLALYIYIIQPIKLKNDWMKHNSTNIVEK